MSCVLSSHDQETESLNVIRLIHLCPWSGVLALTMINKLRSLMLMILQIFLFWGQCLISTRARMTLRMWRRRTTTPATPALHSLSYPLLRPITPLILPATITSSAPLQAIVPRVRSWPSPLPSLRAARPPARRDRCHRHPPPQAQPHLRQALARLLVLRS